MDLFAPDAATNLLPRDGAAHYHGAVLAPSEARRFFDALVATIPWQHDEAVLFGRRIVTARKVAWFGERRFSYAYSGTTKQALPWTTELRELKRLVEHHSGAAFNSCLLNLYHHGGEGMGWHSDDEKALVRHAPIASLSLGAERRFCFKHKHLALTAGLTLENGSLLVMAGQTQTYWLHSLPKARRIADPRINLTFRQVTEPPS